jgi:hypothetical protein
MIVQELVLKPYMAMLALIANGTELVRAFFGNLEQFRSLLR